MFFHIDESGNTGNNLFDENQPVLSYGLLSSKTNIDALGKQIHKQILKVLRVDSIHANILGVDRLTAISPLLFRLQKRMRLDFDYYFIDKPSYAIVKFFDAVFDAGLNPAVKWDTYWTPLRFLYIHKISSLFDEELLKESWSLCKERNIEKDSARIVALLSELLDRTNNSNFDGRTKELISDAFQFGVRNPLELDFGTSDHNIISPNAVCFQFVVSAMAIRLNKLARKNASSIVIDKQSQFNRAQLATHYNLVRIAEGLKKATAEERNKLLFHPLYRDQCEETILGKGTPTKDITISSSEDSIGLQIVDTYLWIANRLMSGNHLSPALKLLGEVFLRRSMTDGISMDAMAHRFMEFEKQLPGFDSLTTETKRIVKNNIEEHRSKVRGLNI